MLKYIDRNALMEYANNSTVGIDANDIARFPGVDAVPVVHGRWTFHSDAKKGFSDCSVCGWHYMHEVWHEYGPSYCPNCGARMDSEDNNETD